MVTLLERVGVGRADLGEQTDGRRAARGAAVGPALHLGRRKLLGRAVGPGDGADTLSGVVGDGGDFGRLAGRRGLGDAGHLARSVIAIIPGGSVGIFDGGQVAARQGERREPAGRVLDRLELATAVIGEGRDLRETDR